MTYRSQCSGCGCGSGYSSLRGGYQPCISRGLDYVLESASSGISYQEADVVVAEFGGCGIEYKGKESLIDKVKYLTNSNYGPSYVKAAEDHTNFFDPNAFCSFDSEQPVIKSSKEVEEYIKRVFSELMGRELKGDIDIEIVGEKRFKSLMPKRGVLGFSMNHRGSGRPSKVVVLEDRLDRLMLTIGHEIGHVVVNRLEDAVKEEAKAFAFSLAWMKKIRELDVANLRYAITVLNPAENGKHNVALDFVMKQLKEGVSEIKLFYDIAMGL